MDSSGASVSDRIEFMITHAIMINLSIANAYDAWTIHPYRSTAPETVMGDFSQLDDFV